MGYQLNHVWKNQRLFKTEGQTKLESSLYYFTWEKELLPEDILLRKVLFLKVCELLENTFPNLREGDKIEVADLGACNQTMPYKLQDVSSSYK